MAVYRVTLDGGFRSPDNLGEISISFERNEDSGAYFWRKQLSGSMIFSNSATSKDYDYIKTQTDIDICQAVNVKIEQSCAFADWRIIYEGEFNRLDCVFREDSCVVEVTPRPLDAYECILQNWEKKYNILEIANPINLDYENRRDWEFEIDATGSVLPDYGLPLEPQLTLGATFQIACPSPIPDTINYFLYARIVAVTRCVGGQPQQPPAAASPWTLLTNNCGVDGTAKWWRRPMMGVDYSAPLGFVDTCTPPPFPPTFCTPSTPPTSPFILIASGVQFNNCAADFYLLTSGFFPQAVLENGRLLVEVVEFLIQKDCPTLSLRSTFFENITNPVTGNPNTAFEAVLYQKSDIVRAGITTEVATLAELSLKALLEDLNRMFNVWWFIDESTNELVIEHISDVIGGVGTDLTTLDGGKWAKNRNTVSFDKIEVPVREEFEWRAQALDVDFVGYDIEYDSTCTSDRVINTKTEELETELTRIFQNEEEDLNGFVLISPASIVSYDTNAEDGVISQVFVPNVPFSWTALHRDYFTFYRYLPSGDLNDVATVFDSTRPIKKQENLTFPICCLDDYDPADLIRTEIGDGVLDSAEYNLSQQQIDVTIKFEL